MTDLDPSSLNGALRTLGDVLGSRGYAFELVLVGGAALLLRGTVSRPLPEGFEKRLSPVAFGALRLWIAGREDLVALKLWAAADRWPAPGRHLADLQALAATAHELRRAADWTRLRDPSPGYRELLVALLARLGVEGADDDAGR